VYSTHLFLFFEKSINFKEAKFDLCNHRTVVHQDSVHILTGYKTDLLIGCKIHNNEGISLSTSKLFKAIHTKQIHVF